MRLFLLISFFTATFSLAFGQLKEPIKGGAYSTARKENFNGFIGENSTTVFTVDYLYVSRKKQELIIRKFYKQDLMLVDSKNIYENPPDGFYGEPLEVFYSSDTIYMFANLYDEQSKNLFITLDLFDVNGVKISSAVLDTLPDDETLHIHQAKNERGFLLVKSNRFSNLTEQELGIVAIDKSGSVLFRQTIKSPMALQNLNIEKMAWTPEGSVFVLCNYNFNPSTASVYDDREMINNKYALWSYNPAKKFLKEFDIRMKGKWINGIEMQLNKKNDLVIAGYFNESRYHTICGVFSLIVDQDLSILESTFEKFDQEVIAKFLASKELEKNKELEDYTLNGLAMLADGSYFLLGERYYKYIERNYDPRTNITTTIEHFNYNSIIVSYFNPDGKHQWTDRIPKYQNSTNDFGYFSSYTYLNTGSDLFIFFNDSDKNNELALNDYFNYKGLFNNRRFQITSVQVDTSGVVSRKPLVGVDNSFILRARQSNQISRQTMYLMTEVGREAKVFSVAIKED